MHNNMRLNIKILFRRLTCQDVITPKWFFFDSEVIQHHSCMYYNLFMIHSINDWWAEEAEYWFQMDTDFTRSLNQI